MTYEKHVRNLEAKMTHGDESLAVAIELMRAAEPKDAAAERYKQWVAGDEDYDDEFCAAIEESKS